MALEVKPLKITDRWCCNHHKDTAGNWLTGCGYIGHPYDEDGKSICIKCKTDYIEEMERINKANGGDKDGSTRQKTTPA